MATTSSERVSASRARVIAAGGRAVHSVLRPEVVQALDHLIAAGYADSATGAISAALLDAEKKIERSEKNA